MKLHKDIAAVAITNSDPGDTTMIKGWYQNNQDDPWPKILAFLSCYDYNEHYEIDKIKYKFLYMCDHCF